MQEGRQIYSSPLDDDFCFIKIPLKAVSKGIAIFKLFCIAIALIAFNRNIIFETIEGVDFTVVWNGNLPTYCRNVSAPSSWPSLFKRFELEPYAKLGFRFALMFPATVRVFFAYCRYKIIEYQIPSNKFMALLSQILPFLLSVQITLCAAMLIINFQLDFEDFPIYNLYLTQSFMISTGIYMGYIIIIDIRQAGNIKIYLQKLTYVIRLLTAMIFAYASYPTVRHVETTQLPVPCNHYADSFYFAMVEYLTAVSAIIFHFTEFFELQDAYLYVIEMKFVEKIKK